MRTAIASFCLVAITLLFFACGGESGSPTGPTSGSIVLRVTTTGEAAPASYSVAVDGDQGSLVQANGNVTLHGLAAGDHEVELLDVPVNCTVTSANPATVAVVAGESRPLDMSVECGALSGSIEATMVTTGNDLDPDGYMVAVDGDSPRPVPVQGSVTISGLDTGQHELTLSGVRGNCTASGGLTRTVTVTQGELASVSFGVECDWNSRILFRSFDDDIYVMKPDGTDVTNITSDPAHDIPNFRHEWSPDGARIAFERNGEIYVVNRDGSGLANVTNHPARDVTPVWSPDGSKIAFASDRDGNLYIYVTSLNGGEVQQVTSGTGERNPDWSRGGGRLAASSYVDNTNSEILAFDLDGSNAVNLSNDPAGDFEPIWSPDGSRLAFLSNRTGGSTNFDIFVVNADGSGLVNVSNSPLGNKFPVWSPDGNQIAFQSQRDGNDEIYVVNADGSDLRRLTYDAAADQLPSWSPDGTRIAFASLRDGHSQVYALAPDGTGLENISDSPMWTSSPSWSPSLY